MYDINVSQYFELELNLLACDLVGNVRILSGFCQHYHCHSIQSLPETTSTLVSFHA